MAPPPTLAALLAADHYENIDADEWLLIQEWLRAYGRRYDRIECNVRVGEGRQVPPTGNPKLNRMWETITKRRADLVAWRGHDVLVIEAKVRARIQAVTQVKVYAEALRREWYPVGRVSPMLICREAALNVEVAMHLAGGSLEKFRLTPGARHVEA